MSLTLAPVRPFLSWTTTVLLSVVLAVLSQLWSWGDIHPACALEPPARAASAMTVTKPLLTFAPLGAFFTARRAGLLPARGKGEQPRCHCKSTRSARDCARKLTRGGLRFFALTV